MSLHCIASLEILHGREEKVEVPQKRQNKGTREVKLEAWDFWHEKKGGFPTLGYEFTKLLWCCNRWRKEQVSLREGFSTRWAWTKSSHQEVVGGRVQMLPSVGFKLGLLRNGDNSWWLPKRREVNYAKYWGRVREARQPWWRTLQPHGGPPLVPAHTLRQPGKDQEEQGTWLEPLHCREICGRGDRLAQSFVGLGQGRTCPRPPVCHEEVAEWALRHLRKV